MFPLLPALNDKLTLPDGTAIYIDMKDGVLGYNTDPERGADTFHPFSGGSGKLTINFSYKLAVNGSSATSETGNGSIIVDIAGGSIKSQSITGSKSIGINIGSIRPTVAQISDFKITSATLEE